MDIDNSSNVRKMTSSLSNFEILTRNKIYL